MKTQVPTAHDAAPAAVPSLKQEILRTLLYYDIWRHPLTAEEIFLFLSVNSISLVEVKASLRSALSDGSVRGSRGYYFLPGRDADVVSERIQKERHARHLWRMARISSHVIKRCPFVRAVFVSGDLSKNVSSPSSDVDFFILTEPERLWIVRTILTLFKKVFLLNSKKYFCLNYFATTDHLVARERNIYVATEIAHLKPLYNMSLFAAYRRANSWIHHFFPNYAESALPGVHLADRKSLLQRFFEMAFVFLPAKNLDIVLQRMFERLWERRYPELPEPTRSRIFRSSRSESSAYVGDFQEKVLALYSQRLKTHGV